MPPRSVKRKKATAVGAKAKAKKLTPKSEQLDVESSLGGENQVPESENEIQQSEPPARSGTAPEGVTAAVQEASEPVIANAEIKQEIGVSGVNSVAVEGSRSGYGDNVVATAVVEVKVEEEMIEEMHNVVSIENDRVNTSAEGVAGVGIGVVKEEREAMEEVVDNDGGIDENGGIDTLTSLQNGDNAAEERGEVESQQIGPGSVLDTVAEVNSIGEETAANPNKNVEALRENSGVHAITEGHSGKGEGAESGDDEEGTDASVENDVAANEDLSLSHSLTESKRLKDLELFVGRLDKKAIENDLIEAFGKFGEIKEVRIARNPTTKKSRGFAFIRYATTEQARNALSVLKDGVEVRGKQVKVSESQNNDSLYIGNICKSWTKESVLGKLKHYGVHHIVELRLPDDPNKEGMIEGYAVLEFGNHSDAMAAFHRLKQPDAIFGCDRSAKVAFTQIPVHADEVAELQIRTVCLEGLDDTWNEEMVREICNKYGEVAKVKLSGSRGTKRKHFSFITFDSPEDALACVEGINNAHLGEGASKVKACIAKSPRKTRLQKQGFRGGFKIKNKSSEISLRKESESTKQAGSSKMTSLTNSEVVIRKGKAVAKAKKNTSPEPKIRGKTTESQNVIKGKHIEAPSKKTKKEKGKKRNLLVKDDGIEKGGAEHNHSRRPSKKRRGNTLGIPSKKFRETNREAYIRKGSDYGAASVTCIYAHQSSASAAIYQVPSHYTNSGSKRRYTDMEPHAGYLEPITGKQKQLYAGYRELQGSHAAYLEPAVGTQVQRHVGHYLPAAETQGGLHARYLVPSVGTQAPHSGYLEPALATRGQSYAGYAQYTVQSHGQSHTAYPEPSSVTQSRSRAGYYDAASEHVFVPYHHGLTRASGNEGQSSRPYAYVGGSALLPSRPPNHATYSGYEGVGGTVGGYYQSSGSYLPPGAYY